METVILIQSLDELQELAKTIASFIKPGYILGLKGDLGSGKTTFTKFFARQIGVFETVNSPTFNILKIYNGFIPLYHMDVYRLENIGYDYELDDYIYGQGVSVIEWYPYIKEMLPEHILEMEILIISEGVRKITIKGSGVYEPIVKALSH